MQSQDNQEVSSRGILHLPVSHQLASNMQARSIQDLLDDRMRRQASSDYLDDIRDSIVIHIYLQQRHPTEKSYMVIGVIVVHGMRLFESSLFVDNMGESRTRRTTDYPPPSESSTSMRLPMLPI